MMLWKVLGVIALAGGSLFGLGSISFWLGRNRQMRLQSIHFYTDQKLDRRIRYAYFTYPFFAAALLASGVAILAGATLPSWPAAMLLGVGVVAAGVGFLVMRFLPAWAKPSWFRAEEAQGFPMLQGPPESQREQMTLLNWIAVVICVSMFLATVLFVLPASRYGGIGLLIGITIASGAYVQLRRHRLRNR